MICTSQDVLSAPDNNYTGQKRLGIFKVKWVFTFAATAYNLVRIRDLVDQAT
jgi:hypothetical protein